jgi:hypothetical protein
MRGIMTVCVVQLARFIIRTILAVALTFARLNSGIAQAQELTAHEPSAAENDSAAEASKQAANPLANAWLMQVQQNTNWIGMPANNGNRVQSNLQFQSLMSVKLSDDWNLITRPIIQMFSTTPFLDQTGQDKRVTAFGDTVLALALSRDDNDSLAGLIVTFFSGICLEQNLGPDRARITKKIDAFMRLIRAI